MAFCTNCGNEVSLDDKFCSYCGASTNIVEQKAGYDGDLHKCPNCGEVLSAFIVTCPSCNYEIRGNRTTNSVHELATKLQQIESNRRLQKKGLLNLLLSNGISHIDEQKVEVIKDFPVPNSREDIIEFVILASSNIDLKTYGIDAERYQSQRAVSDAWLAKLEQVYQKAQLMFGDTQEFLNIHNIYSRKISQIRRKKMELPLLLFGMLIWIFTIITIFAD